MSLDQSMYSAFGDELTKIAIAKRLGKWIGRGWKDVADYGGDAGAAATRGGHWLGKQDTWRRNLPIGPKSIFAGFTGAMVPGAISKKDPLQTGRSRTERSVDLGADVVGGLAGAGALLGGTSSKWRLAKSLVGGIGGSILGSRIATTPWRMARERAARPVLTGQERQQLMRNAVR